MDSKETTGMRVLVIGAGKTGARVIRQLRKNPAVTVITADPRPDHVAVREGLIAAVDIREALTPLNLEDVLRRARPDLVLLAMAPQDLGLGTAHGLDLFADALNKELAALARVPVVEVARGHA